MSGKDRQQHFVLLLFSIAITALIGYLLGITLPLLLILLAAMLSWHLRNIYRLHAWLRENKTIYPPDGEGIWSDIQDMLFRKIHSSRQNRHQLMNVIREFRTAASALPDAVVSLDNRNIIIWMNQPCTFLLGIRHNQDIGAAINNFIRHPDFITWLEKENDEPLFLSSPKNNQVRLSFRQFRYGHDNRLLIARDITERERLEQMRKDFVANVSHELKTPLTVLNGYLETLSNESGNEWQEIAGEMYKHSLRMSDIVQDLLLLSRLETSFTGRESLIDMKAMIATLKKEAMALSKGMHTIEIEHCDDCQLLGSEDLYSAFSNLLSNAVRYTPKNGQIKLSWICDPFGGHFSVTDTGIGIANQHIARLTERFYRVDSGRSRDQGGTGLGLSIVRHVLQQHQARLEIESEIEKGSRFSCHFPIEKLKRNMTALSHN